MAFAPQTDSGGVVGGESNKCDGLRSEPHVKTERCFAAWQRDSERLSQVEAFVPQSAVEDGPIMPARALELSAHMSQLSLTRSN